MAVNHRLGGVARSIVYIVTEAAATADVPRAIVSRTPAIIPRTVRTVPRVVEPRTERAVAECVPVEAGTYPERIPDAIRAKAVPAKVPAVPVPVVERPREAAVTDDREQTEIHFVFKSTRIDVSVFYLQ